MEENEYGVGDFAQEIAALKAKYHVLDRALFGVLDSATNVFMPGLLHTSAETSKRMTETATELAQIKSWIKRAALIGLLLVLIVAFPRLIEVIQLLAKLGA